MPANHPMHVQVPPENWSFETARDAVVQSTLRLFAVCGLLWWIATAAVDHPFAGSLYGIVSMAVLLAVGVTNLTPQLGPQWRVWVVLVLGFSINLLALVNVGLAPGNAFLIFFLILVVTLRWGIGMAVAASGAIALTIAAAAYGWRLGVFPPPSSAGSLDYSRMGTWIRMGGVTVLGALAAAVVIDVFIRRLQGTVTALSAATERLRESEARYRVLFEQAGDHVLVLELRAGALPIIVDANEATLRSHGRRRDELVGQPISVIESELTLDLHLQRMRQLEAGQGDIFAVRHQRTDGVWSDVEVHSRLASIGGKRVIISVARDVTERRRADQALRESEMRFRTLIENAHDAVFVQAESRFAYVNSAALRLFGATRPDQLLGQPILARFHPDFRERILERIRRYIDQKQAAPPMEEVYLRLDGSPVSVLVSAAPITWDGKSGVVVFALDISERKQLETQLIHAQKMEAVGQLAGGVAHDFNNILAASLMNLGLLQMDPTLSPEVRAALTELESGSRRAADLTRQLLMFSRRQLMQVRRIDLDEVLADLLQMLRRLIGENIQLVFAGSAAPRWIEADTGMIEQVVMNLCVNARDAMPLGGTLTLATQDMEIADRYAKTNPEARPGRFVTLSVSDTGCGMDDVTVKRIFEPFFTTKEVGKGTGLGLATVYGIVKQHGGWIDVRSAVAQGSTFEIYLPACAGPDGVESPAAQQPVAGGHETILVVEDESAVRKTVRMCLLRYGYRVLEAETGVQALEIWQRDGERIDLLLTDMIMPEGLTGLQLAERLRAMNPALKVIIASGYHLESEPPPDARPNGFRYLAKPFEATTLVAAVRALLDNEG